MIFDQRPEKAIRSRSNVWGNKVPSRGKSKNRNILNLGGAEGLARMSVQVGLFHCFKPSSQRKHWNTQERPRCSLAFAGSGTEFIRLLSQDLCTRRPLGLGIQIATWLTLSTSSGLVQVPSFKTSLPRQPQQSHAPYSAFFFSKTYIIPLLKIVSLL